MKQLLLLAVLAIVCGCTAEVMPEETGEVQQAISLGYFVPTGDELAESSGFVPQPNTMPWYGKVNDYSDLAKKTYLFCQAGTLCNYYGQVRALNGNPSLCNQINHINSISWNYQYETGPSSSTKHVSSTWRRSGPPLQPDVFNTPSCNLAAHGYVADAYCSGTYSTYGTTGPHITKDMLGCNGYDVEFSTTIQPAGGWASLEAIQLIINYN